MLNVAFICTLQPSSHAVMVSRDIVEILYSMRDNFANVTDEPTVDRKGTIWERATAMP